MKKLNKKVLIAGSSLLLAIVVIITAIMIYKGNNRYINVVKSQKNKLFPKITLGQLLNDRLYDAKWTQSKFNDDTYSVEVTGRTKSVNKKEKDYAIFRFSVKKSTNKVTCDYIQMNDIKMPNKALTDMALIQVYKGYYISRHIALTKDQKNADNPFKDIDLGKGPDEDDSSKAKNNVQASEISNNTNNGVKRKYNGMIITGDYGYLPTDYKYLDLSKASNQDIINSVRKTFFIGMTTEKNIDWVFQYADSTNWSVNTVDPRGAFYSVDVDIKANANNYHVNFKVNTGTKEVKTETVTKNGTDMSPRDFYNNEVRYWSK